MKTLTAWPELPEDVREKIADISANINVLLAYLNGHTSGFTQDNARYHAFEIHNRCQELMKDEVDKPDIF